MKSYYDVYLIGCCNPRRSMEVAGYFALYSEPLNNQKNWKAIRPNKRNRRYYPVEDKRSLKSMFIAEKSKRKKTLVIYESQRLKLYI